MNRYKADDRGDPMNASPSIALAMMAGVLAHRRRLPEYKLHVARGWASSPRLSREKAASNPDYYDVTTEFYRILARLSSGEQP